MVSSTADHASVILDAINRVFSVAYVFLNILQTLDAQLI
jgi:hypothetical protein